MGLEVSCCIHVCQNSSKTKTNMKKCEIFFFKSYEHVHLYSAETWSIPTIRRHIIPSYCHHRRCYTLMFDQIQKRDESSHRVHPQWTKKHFVSSSRGRCQHGGIKETFRKTNKQRDKASCTAVTCTAVCVLRQRLAAAERVTTPCRAAHLQKLCRVVFGGRFSLVSKVFLLTSSPVSRI